MLLSPAVMAGSWSISTGSASIDENFEGTASQLNALSGEFIDDTVTVLEFEDVSVDNGRSFAIGWEFDRRSNIAYGVRFSNSGDLDIRVPLSLTVQVDGAEGLFDGAIGGSLKVTSLDIYANYFIPMSEKVELFVTLGLGRWKGTWDADISGTLDITDGFNSASEVLSSESLGEQDIGDGTSVFYGLGLSYNLNDKMSARVQFENNSSDVDNTSLSLLIKL